MREAAPVPTVNPRHCVVQSEARTKPRHILLYARDASFDEVLLSALFGAGAIVLVARNVADALAIGCRGGQELDWVVMDFNDGCRGLTLLSKMHLCRHALPKMGLIAAHSETASAIAYESEEHTSEPQSND